LACHTLVSSTQENGDCVLFHQVSHTHTYIHVDENPYNSDLGNCLDYTNTPENNLVPGEANFARLRDIYLKDEVGGSSTAQNTGNAVSEQRDAVLDGDVRRHTEVVEDTGHGKDEHGRYFRRVIVRHYLPAQ
jgi:hypothetical protein